jgi:hypothetical protein
MRGRVVLLLDRAANSNERNLVPQDQESNLTNY